MSGRLRVLEVGNYVGISGGHGDRAPSAAANATIRILFAVEGARGLILLALEAFAKSARATPLRTFGSPKVVWPAGELAAVITSWLSHMRHVILRPCPRTSSQK